MTAPASEKPTMPPRRLPRLEQVTLKAFSLYERAPSITIEFEPSGVFCLVGANGLGKSTFLTALNFGITGVVAEPGRTFQGVGDYYKAIRRYSENYFAGRINDFDREAAEIEIRMQVGDSRYRLVRSMFDPTGLRDLEITSAADGSVIVEVDSKLSDEERHILYREQIVSDCGLDEFAQLVFLQLFVCAFDERRHLMFFDRRAMNAAMHIGFGTDNAKAADRLSRRAEGLESRARNWQWQATDLGRQLRTLQDQAESSVGSEEESKEEHESLLRQVEDAQRGLEAARDRLSDAQLRVSERSAALRAARNEYDQIWTASLRAHGHPQRHPVVVTTQDEHACAICGSAGSHIPDHIEHALARGHCPLCDSQITADNDTGRDDLAELASLDQTIVEEQTAIAAGESAIAAFSVDVERAAEELGECRERLSRFENEYEAALAATESVGIDVLANRYRAEIERLKRQRDKERRERDKLRAELRPIQESLVEGYVEAREAFVPNFERLAKKFIGLDLTVELQVRKDSVGLSLDVQGGVRRFSDSLSESQRFFVDIALRMALSQHLTQGYGPAVLYVDAPEGSLDLAYERRAGEMFGLFVGEGHQMVITANLNASGLLRRLAAVCGREMMTLERMTDWTTLSEVQASEEASFDEAYDAILSELEA